MDVVRKWLAALCLGLAALTAAAQGVGYRTLDIPQPTDTGNRVEVIEFFGYFCSHCYSFDQPLREWAKKQNGNIVFKRVHVGFGESMLPHQKLFYALDAMGKLGELHSRLFDAIQSGQSLRKDDQIADFVAKNGVDRNRFVELYNSPYIASLAKSAVELQSLFKVDGVPLIAIDGRYITSPSVVAATSVRQDMSERELQVATLEVMDALVAKVRREKGLAAPAAKSRRK